MTRLRWVWLTGLIALLLPLGMLAAPPKGKPDPKDKADTKAEPTPESIRATLDGLVNLNWESTNLFEVVEKISKQFKLPLSIDRQALQGMGMEPSAMQVEVKAKNQKLRTVLRNVLTGHQLSFGIIGNEVLISSEEMIIYRQLKQRVTLDLDGTPLSKAVKQLRDEFGVNIVLDPRVTKAKLADAPLTVQVDDVPLEAVLRLVSEMAGLKAARIGNVILVTTEERADKIKDSDNLAPAPVLSVNPDGPVNPAPGIVPPQAPQAVPDDKEEMKKDEPKSEEPAPTPQTPPIPK